MILYMCKVIDGLHGGGKVRCIMTKKLTTTAEIGRKAMLSSRFVRISDEVGGIRVYRKFVADADVFDYVHGLLERAVVEVQELQEREIARQTALVKDWTVNELVSQFVHDSSDYVGVACKESDISCRIIEKVAEAFAILRFIVGEEIFQAEFIGGNDRQIEG